MYVDGMTTLEMVGEFKKDVAQSYGWCRHVIRDELRRIVVKASRFPLTIARRWKSKSGNQYVVCFTALTKRMPEHRECLDCRVCYMALIWKRDGWWMFDANMCAEGEKIMTPDGLMDAVPSLFTPHFFQRFTERHGRDGRYKTVYDQFAVSVSGKDVYTSGSREGLKKHGGDMEILSMWKSGYMLGVRKGDLIEYRTYYANDVDLTAKQGRYFNEIAQSHLDLKELYDKMEVYNESRKEVKFV